MCLSAAFRYKFPEGEDGDDGGGETKADKGTNGTNRGNGANGVPRVPVSISEMSVGQILDTRPHNERGQVNRL